MCYNDEKTGGGVKKAGDIFKFEKKYYKTCKFEDLNFNFYGRNKISANF